MTKAPDYVSLYARTDPDRLACVDLPSGRRWSYRSLDAAIDGTAHSLCAEFGLRASDRLVAIAKNSADLVILYLACLRSGIVFVPLNWRLAPIELASMLSDCEPALIVYDAANAEAARQSHGFRSLAINDAVAMERRTPPAAQTRDADCPAVLLYTSGTSGQPKGVIITENNIFHTASNFSVLGRVCAESVFLCESPMFHVIGLLTSLHAPLMHGGVVIMSDGFLPERTIGYFADRSLAITHYFCVPQMAIRLRHDLAFAPEKFAGLVALFTGGAPNPVAEILWWHERGVAMVDGYGMTETGTVLGMSLHPERIREKAGSAGVVAPTVELRIVDNDACDVAVGMAGEIWVRGPNVMPGYWNSIEATRKAFSQDGWFRTGDIGRMDEEGFVSVIDRKKDMYISGGENVYAGEVERRLLDHPAIQEAAVVGMPDVQWGEVGCAFLVGRPGIARPMDVALADFCQAELARYKVPHRFVWLDLLPRTTSGKVRKDKLRRTD